MKYVAPYGVADPNAPYINGDPTLGRQGSIPPAAAFEHPMRELVGVISKSGFTPTDTDLLQLSKGVRSQRLNFCQDTGSANTLSVAADPPITAYTVGLPLRVRVAVTNTGPATLDAGAGRQSIRRVDGSAMAAGDLPAGGVIEVMWDGTIWQVTNFFGRSGGTGDANNFYIKIPFAVDTGAVNAMVANFAPAITALVDGDVFLVRCSTAPTGATTLKVNALAAHPLVTRDNFPVVANLVKVGEDMLLVWDAPVASFKMLSVAAPTAATARYTNMAVFDVAGAYSWVVPANVFQISWELGGAGGAGGSGVTAPGGAPGGAGGYVGGYMSVTPGQSIPLVIGAGGANIGANNGTLVGGTGGASGFNGIGTATGGEGGQPGNGFAAAAGGLGGTGVGGQFRGRGQAGQCSNTPSVNSNYPMGGAAARFGGATGQNLGGYPISNCAGGAGGNNTFDSQRGGDGLCVIHY